MDNSDGGLYDASHKLARTENHDVLLVNVTDLSGGGRDDQSVGDLLVTWKLTYTAFGVCIHMW